MVTLHTLFAYLSVRLSEINTSHPSHHSPSLSIIYHASHISPIPAYVLHKRAVFISPPYPVYLRLDYQTGSFLNGYLIVRWLHNIVDKWLLVFVSTEEDQDIGNFPSAVRSFCVCAEGKTAENSLNLTLSVQKCQNSGLRLSVSPLTVSPLWSSLNSGHRNLLSKDHLRVHSLVLRSQLHTSHDSCLCVCVCVGSVKKTLFPIELPTPVCVHERERVKKKTAESEREIKRIWW